jgi:hypothetical protein
MNYPSYVDILVECIGSIHFRGRNNDESSACRERPEEALKLLAVSAKWGIRPEFWLSTAAKPNKK